MPTYDYECDACGHRFEVFQSMSATTLKKCPECKKNKLRRLIGSGAAIIFKGSGFYETDYRSESYKAGEKAGQEGADTTTDKPKDETSAASSESSKDTSADKSGADKEGTVREPGGAPPSPKGGKSSARKSKKPD